MKRTLKQHKRNNITWNFLDLPNTDFFKFEIVNKMGSGIEKIYNERNPGKNIYGISHLIEHLSFRRTRDFTTSELNTLLRQKGTHNASTDENRINYWFQTTTDNIKTAIKLVVNIAQNNLDKIPEDEINIEKNVVFNEAKRYKDDDQTMFWLNSAGKLQGLDSNDNTISDPSIIEKFTIEDCINIKNSFLKNPDIVYNITYDSSKVDVEHIIEMIEAEISRHNILDLDIENITKEEYNKNLKLPLLESKKLDNESEQFMTYMLLDNVSNEIINECVDNYLMSLSKTSMNELIREQNGLTYGMNLYTSRTAGKLYTVFGCDVSRGTENQLMELLVESVKESSKNYTLEVTLEIQKLKETMRFINQKNYNDWLYDATWNQHIIDDFKYELEQDLDNVNNLVREKYCTYDNIKQYINNFEKILTNKMYGIVTN